jgi:hypothetical protein
VLGLREQILVAHCLGSQLAFPWFVTNLLFRIPGQRGVRNFQSCCADCERCGTETCHPKTLITLCKTETGVSSCRYNFFSIVPFAYGQTPQVTISAQETCSQEVPSYHQLLNLKKFFTQRISRRANHPRLKAYVKDGMVRTSTPRILGGARMHTHRSVGVKFG